MLLRWSQEPGRPKSSNTVYSRMTGDKMSCLCSHPPPHTNTLTSPLQSVDTLSTEDIQQPPLEIQLEAAVTRRRQLRISDFMSGISSPEVVTPTAGQDNQPKYLKTMENIPTEQKEETEKEDS